MLYLARRKLGLSVEQWRALPWWQQRLYEEGLLAEVSDPTENVAPGGESTRDGDELDRVSSFGVKVRRV